MWWVEDCRRLLGMRLVFVEGIELVLESCCCLRALEMQIDLTGLEVSKSDLEQRKLEIHLTLYSFH
jgi:hypothetical protein